MFGNTGMLTGDIFGAYGPMSSVGYGTYTDITENSAPPTPDIISSLVNLTSLPPTPGYSDLSNPPQFSPPAVSEQYVTLPLTPSPQPCYPCSNGSPPSSVEATRTQLIKESLKVTIHSKRNAMGLEFIQPEFRDISYDELTMEDEAKRLRRRERNKVAATKCRTKKKERTVRLVDESKYLEQNNHILRTEIQTLEMERKKLFDLLNCHLPRCDLQTPQSACAYVQSSSCYSSGLAS